MGLSVEKNSRGISKAGLPQDFFLRWSDGEVVSRSKAVLYAVSWGGTQAWREGAGQSWLFVGVSSKCPVILGLR